MKEIVSVGFEIPSDEIDFYEINSRAALSDADIIIFSPIFFGLILITLNMRSFQEKHITTKILHL